MLRKIMAAACVVGALSPTASKAGVTYSLYDDGVTSRIDLQFTVTNQLSFSDTTESITSIGGMFASDFSGGTASYLQGPPGYQPTIQITDGSGNNEDQVIFSSFTYGDPSNGVPGNGSYSATGAAFDSSFDLLFFNGSVNISGVPIIVAVPEPGSLPIVATGLIALLAATGLCLRRAPE